MLEGVVFVVLVEFREPHGIGGGEPKISVAFPGMLPVVSDADIDGLSAEVFEVRDIGERAGFDIEAIVGEGIIPFVAAVLVGNDIGAGPVKL